MPSPGSWPPGHFRRWCSATRRARCPIVRSASGRRRARRRVRRPSKRAPTWARARSRWARRNARPSGAPRSASRPRASPGRRVRPRPRRTGWGLRPRSPRSSGAIAPRTGRGCSPTLHRLRLQRPARARPGHPRRKLLGLLAGRHVRRGLYGLSVPDWDAAVPRHARSRALARAARGPGGEPRCDLLARVGDEAPTLRSAAGKRARVHVRAEEGLAVADEGGRVRYVEIFPPTTFEDYRSRIHRPAPKFIE